MAKKKGGKKLKKVTRSIFCKIPLSIIDLVERGKGVHIFGKKPIICKKTFEMECHSLVVNTDPCIFDNSDVVSGIIYLEQKDDENLFQDLLDDISNITFLKSPELIREASWDQRFMVPIDYSFNQKCLSGTEVTY